MKIKIKHSKTKAREKKKKKTYFDGESYINLPQENERKKTQFLYHCHHPTILYLYNA